MISRVRTLPPAALEGREALTALVKAAKGAHQGALVQACLDAWTAGQVDAVKAWLSGVAPRAKVHPIDLVADCLLVVADLAAGAWSS